MSREAELYKDKIEVSLDGRQIFYLFFGGAVIVGLVFVLGVMVGRRVEARGHTDRARVAATVDPLAALDRLEGGSGLSFQGALRGADGPITDVEKEIAEKASGVRPQASVGPQASGSMPAKVDNKVDAPKVEPKEEPKVEAKKVEAKAEPKKEEVKVEAKKEEPKKVESKKEEPKKVESKKEELKAPEPKKEEVKVEPKKLEAKKAEEPKKAEETKKPDEAKKVDDAKKLASAPDAKATEKKVDEAKKTTEPKPADAKDKKFTLQLSSFQDKAEAQAYLESIKSSGYHAYLTEAAVDGKQYFRVRLGSYKSMEAASEAKADVEKNTKKSAIVIKL
jgi:cell division septation protein DedD